MHASHGAVLCAVATLTVTKRIPNKTNRSLAPSQRPFTTAYLLHENIAPPAHKPTQAIHAKVNLKIHDSETVFKTCQIHGSMRLSLSTTLTLISFRA